MKYLNTCAMLIGLISFGVSSEPVKNEFFIMQNWKKISGDEITLENVPFTLSSSSGKGFSYVFSKDKIKSLEGKKQILKISGSTAMTLSNAMLYESDDLYDDASACKIHYGKKEKPCQKFIQIKKELGLEDELAYSFTDFAGETNSFLIEGINGVKASKIKDKSYYVYFFTFLKDIGEVEMLFSVDKIKINIK
jgi:hypothetical protein